MKQIHSSNKITHENLGKNSHTHKVDKELLNLIDTNFSDRIKNHWEKGEKLSRNGHMRSFIINRKKYIAIIGENKQNDMGDMPDDIKARYGAVIKGYKTITKHIYDSYLPEEPPYEIRYPKVLAYEHTNNADLLVIERVNNLVSLQDIDSYKVNVPNEHIKHINTFLDDRAKAISDLSIDSKIRERSNSRSKYRQFTVKMPYGEVVLNDDFGLRLNNNGVEEQLLKNGGYIIDPKAKNKPILYLTDTLVASNINPK